MMMMYYYSSSSVHFRFYMVFIELFFSHVAIFEFRKITDFAKKFNLNSVKSEQCSKQCSQRRAVSSAVQCSAVQQASS
jgi:hypothetical protein